MTTIRNLLNIIDESPYLIPGVGDRELLRRSMSLTALNRDYNKITETEFLDIYIDKSKTHIVGIDKKTELPEKGRVVQIFRIKINSKFKFSFPNNFQNLIQVENVAIIKSLSGLGFATDVYEALRDVGYTLVSDEVHRDSGKGLWQKISRLNKVYIVSVNRGIFVDQQGIPILYDGTNNFENIIWTSDEDHSSLDIVLVLSPVGFNPKITDDNVVRLSEEELI